MRRRQQVIEAGANIQQHLIASERSVDEGIIAHANMAAALLESRLNMGLGACVERDLVAEAGAILMESFARRERIINLHERFAVLARKLGVDPTGFGDGGDKVIEDVVTGATVHSIAA